MTNTFFVCYFEITSVSRNVADSINELKERSGDVGSGIMSVMVLNMHFYFFFFGNKLSIEVKGLNHLPIVYKMHVQLNE